MHRMSYLRLHSRSSSKLRTVRSLFGRKEVLDFFCLITISGYFRYRKLRKAEYWLRWDLADGSRDNTVAMSG